MKLELPRSKVRINKKKKTVEIPADLFSDLIVYVEGLEAKLLARDIQLREMDKSLREMDELCKKLDNQAFRERIGLQLKYIL